MGNRWRWITLAALVIVFACGILAFRVAVGVLHDRVVDALGPDAEVQELRVGWSSVDIDGLRIKGAKGWPAAETLRAERITIVPSLRSLLSRQLHVRSITVLEPYLSALRTIDGRVEVLPGLLSTRGSDRKPAGSPASSSTTTATIGRITLRDGVVEFFDATVKRPPLKIRLEQIQATVHDVVVPTLTGKTRFDLAGVVKGVERDGIASIAGWAEIATKDSSVKTTLRKVDLVALEPYLIKAREAGVQRGSLDLDLQSSVSNHRLHAPGNLTISGLELAPARGAVGTFMGVPREAVVAFMKNEDDKIAVSFVLEGDVDNPQFSLNETLATRVAFSMAETLGVNVGGLATGAEAVGRKGVEAAGRAGKGVGGAVQELFGGKRKP